jgi:hypothetical protein
VSTVVSCQAFGQVELLTVPVVQCQCLRAGGVAHLAGGAGQAFGLVELLTLPVMLARCPPWCRTNPSGWWSCSP